MVTKVRRIEIGRVEIRALLELLSGHDSFMGQIPLCNIMGESLERPCRIELEFSLVCFGLPEKWQGKTIWVSLMYRDYQGMPKFFPLNMEDEGDVSLRIELLREYTGNPWNATHLLFEYEKDSA